MSSFAPLRVAWGQLQESSTLHLVLQPVRSKRTLRLILLLTSCSNYLAWECTTAKLRVSCFRVEHSSCISQSNVLLQFAGQAETAKCFAFRVPLRSWGSRGQHEGGREKHTFNLSSMIADSAVQSRLQTPCVQALWNGCQVMEATARTNSRFCGFALKTSAVGTNNCVPTLALCYQDNYTKHSQVRAYQSKLP